jgi:hypothetical protein
MEPLQKGKSPFYPGQPVPIELFTGRSNLIERLITRGISQVRSGKPIAMYIQGEYGIGKTSIANFVKWIAEAKHNLYGIYATLGGATKLDDVGEAILRATVQSGALDPRIADRFKDLIGKYVGDQSFYGLNIHLATLKADAPSIAHGALPFLRQILDRLSPDGVKGIMLILDEINGIASNPAFAHFLKSLVDENALARNPVPLFLVVCGTEERRRELIAQHEPVERIFDLVTVEPLSLDETGDFFRKAFESVGMTIDDAAVQAFSHYSAGFPKIMHLIGDAAYWLDTDAQIDAADSTKALVQAAEEVGKKYVDQQVIRALRSKIYLSILDKISKIEPSDLGFDLKSIQSGLTEQEKKNVQNFLRKMRALNIVVPGTAKGEYAFTSRMVRLYIWLYGAKKTKG